MVTEVDHKAQAAILEILEPTCANYDLALLTEESPDNGQRLKKPAFWSIDPMDGTLAFNKNPRGKPSRLTLDFLVSLESGVFNRNSIPLFFRPKERGIKPGEINNQNTPSGANGNKMNLVS